MGRFFERQQDALPAPLAGNFRVQDIRQREYERQAAGRWPLLAAVDEHLWSRHVQRNAFRRTVDPLGAFVEVDPSDGGDAGELFRIGTRR